MSRSLLKHTNSEHCDPQMMSGFTLDIALTPDSAKGGFHKLAQKKIHENKNVHKGEGGPQSP